MDIYRAVDALVLLLEGHVVPDGPQIVADVLPSGGSSTGENPASFTTGHTGKSFDAVKGPLK